MLWVEERLVMQLLHSDGAEWPLLLLRPSRVLLVPAATFQSLKRKQLLLSALPISVLRKAGELVSILFLSK